MAKSKAQKAVKKARKAAKKSLIVAMRPSKAPLLRNPVSKKALKRMMGAGGFGLPQAQYMKTGISAGLQGQNGRIVGASYRLPYREECLGTISTSVNFANTTFILNAANTNTFPWLAPIAAKFEYYRFSKLMLKFVSSSADAVGSTNTALGTMLFNTNYDVLDPAFPTQIAMEDYGAGRLHAETIPSKNITHTMEPAGVKGGVAGGWRYTLLSSASVSSSAPYPASSSAHDYDIGLMQCASAGAQAASVAGRLYICYQVDFANPKLETSTLPGAVHFSGITPTTANNFATATLQSGGSLLLQSIVLGTNTITFPAGIAGNYLIVMTVAGSTSASSALALTPSAGASDLNMLSYGGARDQISSAGTASGGADVNVTVVSTFTVAASGGLVTVTPSVLTGGNAMDLFIVSLPASVLTSGAALPPRAEDRVAALERQVQRLMGLLSPPRSASCVTVEEAEEEAKLLGGKPAALPGDELGNSVHIPRGLLTQFMGALSK